VSKHRRVVIGDEVIMNTDVITDKASMDVALSRSCACPRCRAFFCYRDCRVSSGPRPVLFCPHCNMMVGFLTVQQ
jgi:hypothetical protein